MQGVITPRVVVILLDGATWLVEVTQQSVLHMCLYEPTFMGGDVMYVDISSRLSIIYYVILCEHFLSQSIKRVICATVV